MKGMAAIYTHSLQGDFKRRVRRWSSPRAAFEFPLRGIHCYLSLTGSAP